VERRTTPVKLIALDVDGTLLRSDGTIAPAVHAAIRAAAERGIHVTLATGRRFYAARELAETLGLRLPLILHGGGVIQESATGAVLYEDAIPPDTLADAVALCLAHGYQPVLLESPAHGGRLFTGPLEADNRATREYLVAREGVTRTAHATLPTLGNILSIAIFDDDLPPLLDMQDAFTATLGERVKLLLDKPVTATASIRTFALDAFNAGADKAKALAHLAAQEGIALAEVMVVGDYLNDIGMMTVVRDGGGIAVAMGNAQPEVAAIATAHVATNDADGVAEAIARFVLGQKAEAGNPLPSGGAAALPSGAKRTIRGLIFDFDGLIIDTEMPDFASWQEMFAEHGAELPREMWSPLIGHAVASFDIYDYLEQQAGRPIDREGVQARRRARLTQMIEAQAILPGVEEWIREAKARGMKVGLASASNTEWVTGHLERLGLHVHFDTIKTRDDVPVGKPDPAVYRAALDALGLTAAEAVAFEDSMNGIAAAKAAGLFCVAIPNAMTHDLDLSAADLRLESLAHLSLDELLVEIEERRREESIPPAPFPKGKAETEGKRHA
jgi:Cof subfamily protein (haloacid dehalogenase superfamily)/HAD superfamily hydrolase (TIGR01509 family)